MTPRLRSTSAILVAFIAPLGVYVASLQGGVAFWDTGDLQTVPYILGIPYPTGFPGYVLAGWAWSHLLVAGTVAWRLNLLGALASAGSAAALAALLVVLGAGEFAAIGAALAFALASIPWQHATYVDVHPVSFCIVAWAMVAAVRWQRTGSRVAGAASALLAALALAFDNTTVLALIGVGVAAFGRRPRLAAALPWAAAATLVVVSAYAYLPLRSVAVTAARVDPTLALGIPPGRPYWDDGHPSTPATFVAFVTGAEFGTKTAARSMLLPDTLMRVPGTFGSALLRDFGDVLPWLALFGAALVWWRLPLALAGLATFALVPLLFIFAYESESDTTRYFLPAYFAVAAGAGYGASALAVALPRLQRVAAAGVGLLILGTLLWSDVQANVDLFGDARDTGGADFITRVTTATPSDTIVVAPWVYATPLAYAAYVEHRFGARTLVTAGSKQYAARYRAWLLTRPIVIISDDAVRLRGFTARELGTGSPHLYALR